MKTSVISDDFRARYLSRPGSEGVFEARAIVFDGSDDYHHRINDPALAIDENCILVIRGSGPLGWPGSAEVVNMQPPDALLQRGITEPADARRRAPVGHVGQPLDPQRLARKRGGRRARLAAHRRHDPHRPQRRHLRRAGRRGGDRAAQGRNRRRRSRTATRRGKSCSARRPASWPTAGCSSSRSNIAARQRRRRATITEPTSSNTGTGSMSRS